MIRKNRYVYYYTYITRTYHTYHMTYPSYENSLYTYVRILTYAIPTYMIIQIR